MCVGVCVCDFLSQEVGLSFITTNSRVSTTCQLLLQQSHGVGGSILVYMDADSEVQQG